MNRREALAALVALPEVARISTVPSNSNDTLVVECDHPIPQSDAARIRAQLKNIWPNREVVILQAGLHLKLAPAT